MDKILEVKDLKISFRTQGGRLKAVRNISFDLERGETLAIVGESGSGKSVTSKAILGILAGNSIVEGGEILFDGKDLLKISEEDMQKIRGDKIAMVFQDPLSSLDPIVKIGPQITEAMLLKNKAARRMSRKEFNAMLAVLKENMYAVCDESKKPEIDAMIQKFDKFNIEAIRLQQPFQEAHTVAEELISVIDDISFLIERKIKFNMKERLGEIVNKLPRVKNRFLSNGYDAAIDEALNEIRKLRSSYSEKTGSPEVATEPLASLRKLLVTLTEKTKPDFFRIGFYSMNNPEAVLTDMPIDQLNAMTLDYLNKNFMNEFITLETEAVKHAIMASVEAKKKVLGALKDYKAFFSAPELDKKASKEKAKELSKLVTACINRMEVNKDSLTWTFPSALDSALDMYFTAAVNNPKEEARFARQTARRDALIARGKTIDWKVVPKAVLDLDELKGHIVGLLETLEARYTKDVQTEPYLDMRAKAIELIDYLKAKAEQVVYKLSKRVAKEKAIKLMDEVGIPESRIRFNQYPFEFSGGMRQRIVIAIALSANPDILICDEPTTALDVTIQAQILDLIKKLKEERNLSVIFITHDLGVVANVADKIAVMYAGKVVEYGTANDIFYDPRHPYTWALLSSMPDLDTSEKLDAIPGTPPNMIYPPEGDAFAPRNKYAMEIDFEMQPPEFAVSDSHWAATWLLHPNAPEVDPPKIVTERIERMKSRRNGSDE